MTRMSPGNDLNRKIYLAATAVVVVATSGPRLEHSKQLDHPWIMQGFSRIKAAIQPSPAEHSADEFVELGVELYKRQSIQRYVVYYTTRITQYQSSLSTVT